MNTVDALNVLGKALCGDSFETKPGLTDAETILEIANQYEAPQGGGSGSGSGGTRVIDLSELEVITDSITGLPEGVVAYQYEPNLTIGDFRGGIVSNRITTPGGNLQIEDLIYSAADVTAGGIHQITFATHNAANERDTMNRYTYSPAEVGNMPAGVLIDMTNEEEEETSTPGKV